MDKNIFPTTGAITKEERTKKNGHKGGVLWFTGLSGSGKSTLAYALERELFKKGMQVYVLDGDNVRRGLCADLDFSAKSRTENIRRVGEVAALFADAGVIVIAAFISPFEDDRAKAKTAAKDFHTIYIKANLETCEGRDPKGLYKKARAGEIADFTGISSPYEEPKNPDLVIDTSKSSIDDCVETLVGYVEANLT